MYNRTYTYIIIYYYKSSTIRHSLFIISIVRNKIHFHFFHYIKNENLNNLKHFVIYHKMPRRSTLNDEAFF